MTTCHCHKRFLWTIKVADGLARAWLFSGPQAYCRANPMVKTALAVASCWTSIGEVVSYRNHWSVRMFASCVPEVFRDLIWEPRRLQQLGLIRTVAHRCWQLPLSALVSNASVDDAAVYCWWGRGFLY
eukprot:8863074-Alexandrium_andersonii.AAC.1